MEIQGKIIFALPERSGVSARGEWKVQEFVLETTDSQYPRKMVFDVFGADRLQRFNIQVGQDVNVSFDIDAREYNGRWFNSIRAFDVRQIIPGQMPAMDNNVAQSAPTSAPSQVQTSNPSPVASSDDAFGETSGEGGTDNLPF